ncbi:MAG: hypothetical protein Kow0098_27060 [Ignavibacteriaceae bacterium]
MTGFPLIFKIILVVFTILLVFASLQYYNYRQKETLKRYEDQLSTITELKIAQVQSWKQERLQDGQSIRDNRFFISQLIAAGIQKNNTPLPAMVLETMDYYIKNLGFLSLTYIDSDNLPRINRGEIHRGYENHIINSVKMIKNNRQMFLGEFWVDDHTRPHFPLIIPLFSGDIYQGSLIAEIPTDHFFRNFINDWPVKVGSSEILLVSDGGDYALFISGVRYPKENHKILRIEKTKPDVVEVKALEGINGFIEGNDYRNIPVLAYVDSIPETGWYIIAKTDKAEVFSELSDLSLWLILTSSFLVLAAFLSTLALWKSSTSRFYKKALEIEQEKKSMEKYLSYMSKYANDIIFMIRPDGTIHKSNDRACEVYGYTPVEFSQMTIYDLRSPEESQLVFNQLEKIIKNGSAFFEAVHVKKDGTLFPVEINSRVIRLQDEIFLFSVVRDITERKKAEEDLIQSEKQYRYLFENNPQPMWIYDLETLAFLEVNQAAIKQYGYSKNEFLSLTIKDIRPEEDIPALIADVQKLADDLNIAGTWRHRKKNGEVIFVEITSHKIKYRDKDARLVLVSDITKRKNAERALKETEEKLREVMEYSVNMFYSHTPDHVLTYVSPQSEQFLGYTPEEAKIRWTEFVTDNPVNQIGFEITQRAIETGIAQPPYELELKKKNGEIIWVEVREAPVVKNGKTVAIVGSLTDITEKKSAEDALKKSEEKFRSIAESANDLIYIYRLLPKPEFEYVSPSSEKIVGYSPEEHYSDPKLGMKIIYPEDKAKLQDIMLSKETTVKTQLRWIHRNGKVVWTDSIIVKKINEEGKIELFYGIARDITDRILSDIKLAESERRYKALFEHTNEAIFLLDPVSYLFIDCNPAASRLFGLDKSDIVGSPPYLFSPEKQTDGSDSEKLAKKFIDQCLKDEIIRFEWRHIKPSGEIIECDISLNKVNINSQSLIQMFIRDVTEKKKQEEQIRLLYRSIEQSPASVLMTDLKGNITFANKKLLEVTGYSREDVIGQNPKIFQSGFTNKKVYDEL